MFIRWKAVYEDTGGQGRATRREERVSDSSARRVTAGATLEHPWAGTFVFPVVAALSTLSTWLALHHPKPVFSMSMPITCHPCRYVPVPVSAQAEVSDPGFGPSSSACLPAERLHHARRPPSSPARSCEPRGADGNPGQDEGPRPGSSPDSGRAGGWMARAELIGDLPLLSVATIAGPGRHRGQVAWCAVSFAIGTCAQIACLAGPGKRPLVILVASLALHQVTRLPCCLESASLLPYIIPGAAAPTACPPTSTFPLVPGN